MNTVSQKSRITQSHGVAWDHRFSSDRMGDQFQSPAIQCDEIMDV